jgi:hypothetical protein
MQTRAIIIQRGLALGEDIAAAVHYFYYLMN